MRRSSPAVQSFSAHTGGLIGTPVCGSVQTRDDANPGQGGGSFNSGSRRSTPIAQVKNSKMFHGMSGRVEGEDPTRRRRPWMEPQYMAVRSGLVNFVAQGLLTKSLFQFSASPGDSRGGCVQCAAPSSASMTCRWGPGGTRHAAAPCKHQSSAFGHRQTAASSRFESRRDWKGSFTEGFKRWSQRRDQCNALQFEDLVSRIAGA